MDEKFSWRKRRLEECKRDDEEEEVGICVCFEFGFSKRRNLRGRGDSSRAIIAFLSHFYFGKMDSLGSLIIKLNKTLFSFFCG